MNSPADRLREWLLGAGPLAVAVSGGIDSLTLATMAHRIAPEAVTAFHASSAAVPSVAGGRVRRWAQQRGIPLHIVDAGELSDPRYLSNPVDRCLFCKSDLYATIAQLTNATIISGTNTDDLREWRPGLRAAVAAAVRHPYLDCGIDKATVRQIARELGLRELADLPAAPCLASRVETGLPITAHELHCIDKVEREVTRRAGPGDIRCRLRETTVVIEVDRQVAERLTHNDRQEITGIAYQMLGNERPVHFAPYQRGAAFVGIPSLPNRT